MEEPKLVRRRANSKSTIKSGRTIGEKRERLETANERAAARKKDKQKSVLRVILTICGFAGLAAALVGLFTALTSDSGDDSYRNTVEIPYSPTIDVIDEDSAATGGEITSRMSEYIGQAETDLRALGYIPTKAVLPTGKVREVDFYLDGYPGFIKMSIDRGAAVSAEDVDRMIRYLEEQGITDFEYIDVRVDGRAYWK